MKRISKFIYTCLFLLFLALGAATFIRAQEKKPAEKPKVEDKLKLTEQENAALDGLLRENQQKAQAVGALEQELIKEGISDDRIILLVERWRKLKGGQAEIDTNLNNWWQAVRNRADCQKCTLDQTTRRLIEPAPEPKK